MNYHKQYGLLIKKALNRPTPTTYTEKHHIKPRCIGGSNSKHNLVTLTAREHYMAHWFLVKMYPENDKLVYALNMMTHGQQNKYLNLSAKDFEKVRMLHSQTLVDYFKNPENRNRVSKQTTEYFKTEKGKKQSKIHSEKLIEYYKNPENRNHASKKTTEYYKNPENRRKMSIINSKRPFTIHGDFFLNLNIASSELGIGKTSIHYRLQSTSKRFKDYKYI